MPRERQRDEPPSFQPPARRTKKKGAAAGKARGERVEAPKSAARPRLAKTSPPADRGAATPPPTKVSPEEMLDRAMRASTPRARATWAKRGLASRTRIDRVIHSALLRQLYLAHYESRRFEEAIDVAHQDLARALQAMGEIDEAAGQLRLAARVGPPKRRAFHWWTLGSLYFLAGRFDEAIAAIARAARWGTTDKPLYQGHLAIAQCASGKKVDDLAALIERLAEAPAGQGYGRFVLGQLAFYDGRAAEAQRWLETFVKRSESGRPAVSIALEGEVRLAKTTLAELRRSA